LRVRPTVLEDVDPGLTGPRLDGVEQVERAVFLVKVARPDAAGVRVGRARPGYHDVVARVEPHRQYARGVLQQRHRLPLGLVRERRVGRLVEAVRAVDRVTVRVLEEPELEL